MDAKEIMHEEFKIVFEKDLATDFSFENEIDSKSCSAASSPETECGVEMGTSSLLFQLLAVVSACLLELGAGDSLVELSRNARIHDAFPNCSDFWAHIAKELALFQLNDASLLFGFAQTSLEAVVVHDIALVPSSPVALAAEIDNTSVFSCESSQILMEDAPLMADLLNAAEHLDMAEILLGLSCCSAPVERPAAEAPVKPATVTAKPKAKRESKKVATGPVTRSKSRAATVPRRVTRSMTRKAL